MVDTVVQGVEQGSLIVGLVEPGTFHRQQGLHGVVPFIAGERRVERQVVLTQLDGAAGAVEADLGARGDLLSRRRPTQLLRQTGGILLHFLQVVDLTHGGPRRPALLGERLEDRLPDPPHGIGDKLEAARFVEALDRLQQAAVALGDQFREGHAVAGVFLGYGDNEPQVGRHQGVGGGAVPGAGALHESDLIGARQRLKVTDIPPVAFHQVGGDAIAGRRRCSGFSRHNGYVSGSVDDRRSVRFR